MKARLLERRRPPATPPPAAWSRRLNGLVARAGHAQWSINIALVDDEEMAAVNRDWRGKDEPTDVLSFSYLEAEGTGRPDLAAGELGAARGLWRGPAGGEPETLAGEIILAPGWIDARCAAHGWDREAEWALLVVHGMLHVLGWQHGDERSAAEMRSQEAELLRADGVEHPLLGGGGAAAEGE